MNIITWLPWLSLIILLAILYGVGYEMRAKLLGAFVGLLVAIGAFAFRFNFINELLAIAYSSSISKAWVYSTLLLVFIWGSCVALRIQNYTRTEEVYKPLED